MFFSRIVSCTTIASRFVSSFVSQINTSLEATSPLELVTIYKFPEGVSGSNLAQARDGSILATTQGSPSVYRINDKGGKLIATFPFHENTFGIVELADDVFYVNAANYTHAPSWRGIRGSNTLYRLSLNDDTIGPRVSTVATISPALTLDGMAILSKSRGLIMMGDTQSGELYVVNTHQNSYRPIFQSPLFNMTATTPGELTHVGINGLEIQHRTLYYTNTARNSFGRVTLSRDGVPTGSVEVLLPNIPLPDDFAIDDTTALLSELQHGLFRYDLSRPTSAQKNLPLVANLPGANSAKFGRADTRDYCTLYALYNRKVINGTGSGLVKANLRGKGLRRGC